ncbi:MAG: ABC transporter ATP-binding protein [Candidatus Cryosericum sp.]
MNVVELSRVMKSYGTVQALNGLDLAVPQGSIFGLMGPNGAGKTTSIKLVLGLMKPDAGTVRVLGKAPGPRAVELRRRIGFVPEDFALYPYMTGEEVLRLNGQLYRCSVDSRVDQLQSVFDLPLTRRIATYSKGMRKLLALYLALSTDPELLILDEPTDGLDPVVRSKFLGVLADQTAERRLTVFFSSHVLSEVEKICDTVAFMRSGKTVLQDEVESLKVGYRVYTVRFAAGGSPDAMKGVTIRRQRLVSEAVWDVEMYGDQDAATQAFAAGGGSILQVQVLPFEEIFMRFMEA